MAVSLTVDGPRVNYGDLEQSPLDLNLHDEDFWVGEAGLGLQISRNLLLFGSAMGNVRRAGRVFSQIEPEDGRATDPAWWGSKTEWWQVDVGGGLAIRPQAAIMVGLRVDHLQIDLRDPFDPDNNEWADDNYYGDLLAKMWIPYFGIQLLSRNHRAILIGSPFASTELKLPFRFIEPDLTPPNVEEARYTGAFPGVFLEGLFEYILAGNPRLRVNMWLRGSLMKFSGKVDGDLTDHRDRAPRSFTADSNYSRHSYSAGMSGMFVF
jgi:hypothetical protein